MKKRVFTRLVLGATLFTQTIKAQGWYGQITYQHDDAILSSGKYAPITNGFILGSYLAVSTAAQGNFSIDFVDQNTGAGLFMNEYKITDCSGNISGNCMGVTVIETLTNGASGITQYALVGTTQYDLFFCTLDAAFNVIPASVIGWHFPASSTFCKPVIRESQANPGQFYICTNTFGGNFYVMKVDDIGTIYFSNEYPVGGGTEVRDLIESPYGSLSTTSTNQDLVLVGRTISPAGIPVPFGSAVDGFLLWLDGGSGAYITDQTYSYVYTASNPFLYDSDDWFSCIEIANSTNSPGGVSPGNGYVVGGRAMKNNPNNSQWVSKINQTGTIVWSSLIEPLAYSSGGGMAGSEISRVQERYNFNTGAYEYYAVTEDYYMYNGGGSSISQQNNLTVYKLDDAGQNSLSPSEFHYPDFYAAVGAVSPYHYADLSILETNGASGTDGFQAYGTNSLTTVSGFPNDGIVKAYFNGVSGCNEEIINIENVQTPTVYQYNMPPFTINSITPCSAISISPLLQVINNPPCINTPPVGGGSNAKQASATGIDKLGIMNSELSIYPNPAESKLYVNRNGQESGSAEISVFNTLGQCVKTQKVKLTAQAIEIDVNDLPAGVYILKLNVNGNVRQAKAVIAK